MLHVWNINIHLPQKWPSFVGKSSSTMEHLGGGKLIAGVGIDVPMFHITQLKRGIFHLQQIFVAVMSKIAKKGHLPTPEQQLRKLEILKKVIRIGYF